MDLDPNTMHADGWIYASPALSVAGAAIGGLVIGLQIARAQRLFVSGYHLGVAVAAARLLLVRRMVRAQRN